MVRTQGISTQPPSATVPLSPIFSVALRRGRNGRKFQQAVEENSYREHREDRQASALTVVLEKKAGSHMVKPLLPYFLYLRGS